MYSYSDLRVIHLELTSRCNAACPMCQRNLSGGAVNPDIPLTELTLEDIQKFFSPELITRLSKVYLCGNYGDPAVARDTLEVLKYFRSHNAQLNLGLHSNASVRTPDWWQDLGEVVSFCRFGIDGLKDTNHLYRRNTSWKRIIENARAFISARKGAAEWDYIVFRHNEHQVEEARSLAAELGFKAFRTKRTSRFQNDGSGRPADKMAVLKTDGSIDYWLEMPMNAEYINDSFERSQKESVRFGGYERYLDQVSIDCKIAKEKSIYVSAEGLVFPCCWTAGQLYTSSKKPADQQIREMVKSLPERENSLSLFHRSIADILQDQFFQKDVPESWNKAALSEGKLKVCSRVCAKDNDPFTQQFGSWSRL